MARADKTPPRAPVLEWIMAALGLVVTGTVLAVLLGDAHRAPTPPRLTVTLVDARPMGDVWAAEVEVTNGGDETAARVRVALMGVEADTDYVAGHGRTRLTLVVPADPAAARPVVRGWSEP